jgi:hypothetical protein
MVSGRVSVTLRKASGDIDVPALPTPVPGLLVAEDPGFGFSVIHHSGVGVALDFGSPEAALACAEAIGPLIDWSASVLDVTAALILDQDAVGAIIDARRRWGGGGLGAAAALDQLSAWSAS